MRWKFRLKIVLALKSIDYAIIVIDIDQDGLVVKSIEYISDLIRKNMEKTQR